MKVKELIAKLCNHNNMDDEVFIETNDGLLYINDVEHTDGKVIIHKDDIILDKEDDKYKKAINDALDRFDFQKVHNIYNAGIAIWDYDADNDAFIVPKIDELKEHAMDLIMYAMERARETGDTGSVEASKGDFSAKVYGVDTDYFEVYLYFIPYASKGSTYTFGY